MMRQCIIFMKSQHSRRGAALGLWWALATAATIQASVIDFDEQLQPPRQAALVRLNTPLQEEEIPQSTANIIHFSPAEGTFSSTTANNEISPSWETKIFDGVDAVLPSVDDVLPGINVVLPGADVALPGVDVVLPFADVVLPDTDTEIPSDVLVPQSGSAVLPTSSSGSAVLTVSDTDDGIAADSLKYDFKFPANEKDLIEATSPSFLASSAAAEEYTRLRPFLPPNNDEGDSPPTVEWLVQSESLDLNRLSKSAFTKPTSKTPEVRAGPAVGARAKTKTRPAAKKAKTLPSATLGSPSPTTPTLTYSDHYSKASSAKSMKQEEKTATPPIPRLTPPPPLTQTPSSQAKMTPLSPGINGGAVSKSKKSKRYNKSSTNKDGRTQEHTTASPTAKGSSSRKQMRLRYKKGEIPGSNNHPIPHLTGRGNDDKLHQPQPPRDYFWHRPDPPIDIPRPRPATTVPSTPAVLPPSPTIVPQDVTTSMPSIQPPANDGNMPLPLQSSSMVVLALDFQQTRIPTSAEVDQVVALVDGYIVEQIQQSSPTSFVIVSLDTTRFRLGYPYEIVLELVMENNDPAGGDGTTLETLAETVLADEQAIMEILETHLPTTNVFRTTSSISYSITEGAWPSARRRNGVSMALSSGGIALLALLALGGWTVQRRGRKGDRRDFDGSYNNKGDKDMIAATVAGDTIDATTIKTRSVGFPSDEMLSLSNSSGVSRPVSRFWRQGRPGEQRRFAGDEHDHTSTTSGLCMHHPDDCDGEEAEYNARIDPLARPPGSIADDDITVDSYVPVGVIDLIKFFTPAQ